MDDFEIVDPTIAELMKKPSSEWTEEQRSYAQEFLTQWFKDRGIDINMWLKMRKSVHSR